MVQLGDPPSQTHSQTSVWSGRSLSRTRVLRQEKWVYEALRRGGASDWQLWEMVQYGKLFDKLSSLRRARIGLMWRSRALGATPWHPVEDSGQRNKDPNSNKRTVIWQLKQKYRAMPYEGWAHRYRALARGQLRRTELI